MNECCSCLLRLVKSFFHLSPCCCSMSSSHNRRQGRGGGGGGGGNERRRRDGSEGPSSSRQRWNNEVWPEPFLEALAYRVATDAAISLGTLAAAPALSTVFQVCSTWHAVSLSDRLWQNLSRGVWRCGARLSLGGTWRTEYVLRHRTASNFRSNNAVYTSIHLLGQGEDDNGLICRRLALSETLLACGMVNGSVRVYHLSTGLHRATFRPQPRDLLGHFSGAVSGLVLHSNTLVFASLDGDVHVALIIDDDHGAAARRVQLGDVVNDGTLVDFSGCERWWVGLYAGVPGRSFHVWNAHNEHLLFVGGSLTDLESLMGWHLLTDLTNSIGRVRMMEGVGVVACTAVRLMSLELQLRRHDDDEDDILVTSSDAEAASLIVDSVDVSYSHQLLLLVDNRGVARIRTRVAVANGEQQFQEGCRFRVRSSSAGTARLLGCINSACAFIWTSANFRAWDAHTGRFLYNLTDSILDATALVSDDTRLAIATADATIHIWDFTAI